MTRSRINRIISFAAAIIMIACLLPAAGAYAVKPLIVHEINVINVAEPVAGAHPVYQAELSEATAYVYPDSDQEGAINGIYWIELNKDGSLSRRMNQSETFREGYDYVFGVCVAAADFAQFDNYYVGELNATINGNTAEIWPYEKYVCIVYTFHCGSVIDTVELTVVRPKVGNTPTFAKINTARFESKNDDPKPSNQTNGVTWTNMFTGINLTISNPFKENTEYLYKVSLYPKDGYSFAEDIKVYVNGMEAAQVEINNGRAIISAVMPATYKNPFVDVPEEKWFTTAVLYCNYNGFMTGTSETTFSPDSPFTRAMFVTVLAKIDRADTESYTGTSFDDVADGKWYSKPIEWAFKNEYASGLGNGKFGPNDPVTREQLARFLYNYVQKKGIVPIDYADVSGYPDADKVSNYAKDAISWAVGNGLISGVKTGSVVYLSPKGTATRAQVAVIVRQFIEGLKTK